LTAAAAAAALAYPVLAVVGLVLSAYLWERALPHGQHRSEPGWNGVFLGALAGMVLGAKLGYALAEGLWSMPEHASTGVRLWHAFEGKTVAGGLLGAYLGVELAKRSVGMLRPTGDAFALVAPVSLVVGRIGCLFGGCCLGAPMPPAWFTVNDAAGIARWPAVWAELAFNALFFVSCALWTARRRSGTVASRLDGQLFHVYLVAYGAFRFAHEWLRDTPRILGTFTGYQVLALALVALGAVRFVQRDAPRASMRA
jgi:phosphatidylglycerol:prolipoprotein diacylglycerol transferase